MFSVSRSVMKRYELQELKLCHREASYSKLVFDIGNTLETEVFLYAAFIQKSAT